MKKKRIASWQKCEKEDDGISRENNEKVVSINNTNNYSYC
jgi:hypothetical protein